ncbi:MAG: response regulator transcription factor [Lachnospiraceae bacterium]
MKTIIIVEDEYKIRQGLTNLINKLNLGCSVIGEAENGYEGLKLIRDLDPNIIITDIQMPKMTGLEMMKQAREMGIEKSFVVLSGYADFQYAKECIQYGVAEYLLKPATISDVKYLLEKLTEDTREQNRKEDREKELIGYSRLVQEIIQDLEKEYAMRISLDILAERYRHTPEYISNLFTKETGMNVISYLKKIRIKKAQDLILHSDMKIYEIACAVGYPDQKYFSKVFKEYTGVSAKQYTIEHKKK